jgi:GAF domain-containing protein
MQVAQLVDQLEALVARGASFEAVLEAAVRGTHQLDPRFDWTGIYELYPDQVFIGVGTGGCGTAVAEKRNQNIPDVRKITNYLACSTETRSELVVLIRTGDAIHAQIDIDSHQVAAFDTETEGKVQRIADWLARRYEARAAASAGR